MADIFDEVVKKRDVFDDVAEIGGSMPTSAITGQPVPTSAENILQSKRAVAEILPIAGDIAGTAIMPQLKLAKAAPLIARAGAGAANMLLRGAGAGAGSVVGEVEKQVATGDFDPNQVYMQGALGAGGEVAMGLGGAGLKAVEKPALEVMSDLTLSGGKLKQVMTQRLKNYAEKRSTEFVKTIAPDSIKGKIDEVGIGKAITESLDESKALYNHFKDSINQVADKNNGVVPLPKTRAAIELWYKEIADPAAVAAGKIDRKAESEIIKEFGFKGSDDVHITIRKLARGEDLTAAEVMHLQSNIFPKKTSDYMALHPSKQGYRQEFKDVLMSDLDAIGAAVGKQSADTIFKETKRFEAVKNIFDRSMSINKETGERKFLPYQFVENVQRSERLIRQTMPDLWPKLKAEADYFATVADRLQRGERNLGGPLMLSGLASSYFTGGFPVAEFFGAGSAWALMSPAGQATLEGLFKYALKPATKAGLHVGGSLIDLKASH